MAAAKPDPRLRTDLLKRLKISPQALSQRRQRLQREVAMPIDIATYIIAHREGMRIDRYLDHETIERVNRVEAQLASRGAPAAPVTPAAASRKSPPTRAARAQAAPAKSAAAVLSASQVENAERMATQAYPVLYVFENSVREFVDGHLTAAYGKDWFSDSQIVSKGVRDTVDRNRKAEQKNRYHSERNARPIYYTNLDDLSKIVQSQKGWAVFKDLFPRPTWFPELVGEFEVSRNVVAHMNPLRATDLRRLQDGLAKWSAQVKDHMPVT